MTRRLKPVKDLSVLILAQRKHDRQLWAELLKNCGINNPISMSSIEQATTTVGSGQADVVFVDESYGPRGIANVLIPARNVEFAGGRGVCLILCSKKATAQDVLTARKLGFASVVILPASTGTVQKHLELAARYIPPSDEELGWSAPKISANREAKEMPAPKDDPASVGRTTEDGVSNASTVMASEQNKKASKKDVMAAKMSDMAADAARALADLTAGEEPSRQGTSQQKAADHVKGQTHRPGKASDDFADDNTPLSAPGRSGRSAEEELVFL